MSFRQRFSYHNNHGDICSSAVALGGLLVRVLLITTILRCYRFFIYCSASAWRITFEFRYFSSLSMETFGITNFDAH
ncbi:hypothetical protein APHNP_0359 [Anaplasma phagocytophilum str. ApNP]|uniref:Uncharacterized protein n=1 Tax=Anaplasma phagocytophilum str. ApNP TaxID=1359153 RepID=A0A0F3NLA8_ANAPH|nr:hypothetical protein APHNP_0359 [Anaplasma phagocytophilum str. ApNP]